MSIIERAAERLEQLRKAGVEVPPVAAGQSEEPQPAPPVPEPVANAEKRPAKPPSVHVADAPADAPIADPRQLEESGRRSKLVEIDLAALAEAGFVTPEAQRSQIADEFRVLKRPVIKNAVSGAGG